MINPQLKAIAEAVKKKYSAILQADESLKINDLIRLEYQIATGAKDFRKFNEWKEAGFKVKKGEKGFPVFSKPVRAKDTQEEGEEKKGKLYFHTAHLFNETQVEQFNQQ